MTDAGRALLQGNAILREIGASDAVLPVNLMKAIVGAIVEVAWFRAGNPIVSHGVDHDPYLYLLIEGVGRVEFPRGEERTGRGMIQRYSLFGWACVNPDGSVNKPCTRTGTVYAQGPCTIAVIDVQQMNDEARALLSIQAAYHQERMKQQGKDPAA